MTLFINNYFPNTFQLYEKNSFFSNFSIMPFMKSYFTNVFPAFSFTNSNIFAPIVNNNQNLIFTSYKAPIFNFNLQNIYDSFSYTCSFQPSIVNNNVKTTVKKQSKTYNNTRTAVNTSSWQNFSKQYGVKKVNICGSEVYACRWSDFSQSQSEWLGLQKYMIQAADELGLTLVYSDMDRTVSASNASRAKKGSIVAKGGQSPHNYGVATDICLFKNGKLLSVNSSDFTQFAQLVKQKSNNRIAWGGDWKKKNEEHHFELYGWRSKYKTSENLIT